MGIERQWFFGKQRQASVGRTYDIGTTGWWVLLTVFYLAWVGVITTFVVLLTPLPFLASLGIGLVGAVVIVGYGFLSSLRRG